MPSWPTSWYNYRRGSEASTSSDSSLTIKVPTGYNLKLQPSATPTPNYWIVNDDANISISGHSVFLRGPCKPGYATWAGTTTHADTTIRLLSLGAQETWVSISPSGPSFSPNFRQVYPTFSHDWASLPRQRIRQIVLGQNGNYFIKGSLSTAYRFSTEILSQGVVPAGLGNMGIDVCALGVDGTFIITWTDGRLFYNLKGYYPGLERWLESYVRFKGQGARLKAAGLDIQGSRFFVLSHNGGALCNGGDSHAAWVRWWRQGFRLN
ncbi:hypothetical protein M011DRAFT_52495 [Sporormia fimetaria CBS 119925]|uniref:Uncharacterized protein n=1 Tax=Sporormia fimetaria CBS 119925 TaxID=1340428 RepID=A0A6A6V9E7_9PLEO|nr:hypothetical protein M011DRAFT_52495 [Sporormia fimetaria CBS 119925]